VNYATLAYNKLDQAFQNNSGIVEYGKKFRTPNGNKPRRIA
jgi:hypothetical protein